MKKIDRNQQIWRQEKTEHRKARRLKAKSRGRKSPVSLLAEETVKEIVKTPEEKTLQSKVETKGFFQRVKKFLHKHK